MKICHKIIKLNKKLKHNWEKIQLHFIKTNMFNGIIFNQGTVQKIEKRPKGINIFIKSNLKLSKKESGVSVACDGVCLTLITI